MRSREWPLRSVMLSHGLRTLDVAALSGESLDVVRQLCAGRFARVKLGSLINVAHALGVLARQLAVDPFVRHAAREAMQGGVVAQVLLDAQVQVQGALLEHHAELAPRKSTPQELLRPRGRVPYAGGVGIDDGALVRRETGTSTHGFLLRARDAQRHLERERLHALERMKPSRVNP